MIDIKWTGWEGERFTAIIDGTVVETVLACKFVSRIVPRIIVITKLRKNSIASKFSPFSASRSPRPLTKMIVLSYFRQPRCFTFTRNLETLSRQFSLFLLFSLFLFASHARCRFLCRHPYFSVAVKFRYEPLSSGWIKEEETGLKETHNLAKGRDREREKGRDRETRN